MSAEIQRIKALPRRTWSIEGDRADAHAMSLALRRPGSEVELFPIQARCLFEAWAYGGLVGGLGVGRGKTLLSALLFTIWRSIRPLLVIPAGLMKKTEREFGKYARDWPIYNHIKIVSYEQLGRVSGKDILDRFVPDTIVKDECHYSRNLDAAVSARLHTWIRCKRAAEAGPEAVESLRGKSAESTAELRRRGRSLLGRPRLHVADMSGTIFSKSIRDIVHFLQWCIPEYSPVPWTWSEAEIWHYALDVLPNEDQRIPPGALLEFCDARENDAVDETDAARRGWARRLWETPGVVITTDDPVKASLRIVDYPHPPSAMIDKAFDLIRQKFDPNDPEHTGWQLPDGTQLVDVLEVARHAREIALGFFYKWAEPAPQYWLDARAAWKDFARGMMKSGRGESYLDVALMFPTAPELLEWQRVRGDYEPKTVPVWICDSVLKDCAKWLHAHPKGIVWAEHQAFGEELERVSGVSYYGRKGLNSSGVLVDDAVGPVIVSARANTQGRNLQYKWHENLMLGVPTKWDVLEQRIGRTHREGQEEDTVFVHVLLACIEHARAFENAIETARFQKNISRQENKLSYADVDFPSVVECENRAFKHGARWHK